MARPRGSVWFGLHSPLESEQLQFPQTTDDDRCSLTNNMRKTPRTGPATRAAIAMKEPVA